MTMNICNVINSIFAYVTEFCLEAVGTLCSLAGHSVLKRDGGTAVNIADLMEQICSFCYKAVIEKCSGTICQALEKHHPLLYLHFM